MSALLTLSLSGLTGCAKQIVIHPITNRDFAYIQKGVPAPIDGYMMSEFYIKEVLQVKIDNK